MRRSQVLPGYPHTSAGAYGDALAQARSRPHCPTGTSKYSWIYEHAVPLVSRSQTLTRKVFVWESGYARLQFAYMYLDPFHLTCLSLAGPRRCVQRCAANVFLSMRNEWTFEPWTFESLVPVPDWNRNKFGSLGMRLFGRKSYDRNGHTLT